MGWIDCDKCIHNIACGSNTDEHNYFGECKFFEDKNNFNIVTQAFQLLISDVDMNSNDDTVFKRIYDEICNVKCVSSMDCKECLKKYYIERAINKLKQEGEVDD